MNWRILDPDPEIVSSHTQEFHCMEIIAKIMANRGINSFNDSHSFFNPDLNLLHDPFLMKDMARAVDRVILNIDKQSPILIFGDYDVDGTTAADFVPILDKNRIIVHYGIEQLRSTTHLEI